jgi:hypothetical protein
LIRPFAPATLLLLLLLARRHTAEIKIGYLHESEPKGRLSLLDIAADDDGIAGARLAIEDNNTTGKFLDQQYLLEEARLPEHDDPAAAIATLVERGIALVIADVSPEALLKVADAGRPRGILLFNVGATDDRLREAPTLAMVGVSHHYVARRALVDVSFSEQINWISLAVVCGCTALFMVGGIVAYDPSRGLLARCGEP